MKNCFAAVILIFSVAVGSSVYGLDWNQGKDSLWYRGINQYIKYAPQDTDRFGANQHPVSLDINELNLALDALQFNVEKGFLSSETVRSVFTVAQKRLLSEYLVAGLKDASPDQDIIFVLEKVEENVLSMQSKAFVAGRVFYQDDQLNIILGEYDYFRSKAFESVYDPSGNAVVPYSFNYGNRLKRSRALSEPLVGFPGVSNKVLEDVRYDWFVIEPTIAASAMLAKQKREEPAIQEFDERLQQEAKNLARERRLMRAEMARMRQSLNKNGNGRSIESRLENLQKLLDKGLINEDEYAKKREKILAEI